MYVNIMNNIIDIKSNILFYKNIDVNYIIDINNIVWYNYNSVSKILKYKNSYNLLKYNINKKNKILLKNIKRHPNDIISLEHPNTIYINKSGLFLLLIESKTLQSVDFQRWLIYEAIPMCRDSLHKLIN